MNNDILDYAVEQTVRLCRIPSPTGYTKQAAETIMRQLEAMGYTPSLTLKGAVLCRLGGAGRGLLLAAHVDTLGLIVRSVKPNGRLRYEPLSGYSHFNAATENVTVFTRAGKTYTGTIQCDKPSVHVWGDTDKVPKDDGAMEVLLDEEVGHGGASGIPEGIEEIISVDMGAVGGDLGCDEYKVSICAKDSAGPYHYDVVGALIAAADAALCAYAVDIYPHYGSDVDVSLRAGYDVRHGLIGLGVYASHGYERTHRKALESTIKLLEQYVSQG